ncbi:hypothetical protein P5673_013076 [Acropora cervicornis]|uniref:Uncharacterized protein n=1 Tax=Acropora cervicornis TaxID=6130 RepID=A0AAD9QLX7_ACRCE|nr:hypothetical protein P5673_013076 [Acropora cervicornis]
MDSRVSILLVLFCLSTLFNESQCSWNPLKIRPTTTANEFEKDGTKKWERDLREFAATKRQLCDLVKKMDCPLSTH